MSAALKNHKNTVAPIILKWKKFGTTKTLPRDGHQAKLSYRGRRASVSEVTIGFLTKADCSIWPGGQL